MMKCSKCGQPVQVGQAFCKHCGSRIVAQVQNEEQLQNAPQSQNTERIPKTAKPQNSKQIHGAVQPQNTGQIHSAAKPQNTGQTHSAVQLQNTEQLQKTDQPIYNPSNIPSQPTSTKKKSAGPIIAIIVLLVLIIFAVGGYFGFTIYKQNQIKERYKEVKRAVENGVELNASHQDDLDDVKDAQSSLNVFAIMAAENTADDLIAFSKIYTEGEEHLKEYEKKTEELNLNAKAAGIDVASSEKAKSVSDKIDELEDALEDNNAGKIKTLSKEIPDEIDNYEATIDGAVEANKAQAQKNAESLYKKYEKRFHKAVKKSKKKKVHKKYTIRIQKNAAKKALNAYSKAVKSKDLKKQKSTRIALDKKISAFEKSVEKAVKKAKKTKKSKWSGEILPGVYRADGEEFTLGDSSYLPYTSNANPFEYHSNLYDIDRYCLCILAINEVYARHGAHFETESLREYFNTKSWYVDKGISTDKVKKKLSKTERNNVNVFAGWRDRYKEYVSGATGNASDFTRWDYEQSMRYFQRNYD